MYEHSQLAALAGSALAGAEAVGREIWLLYQAMELDAERTAMGSRGHRERQDA